MAGCKGAGSSELYNHETDPGEYINLANEPEYASIVEEHKKWIVPCLESEAYIRPDLDWFKKIGLQCY